jgi:hypothetical protein
VQAHCIEAVAAKAALQLAQQEACESGRAHKQLQTSHDELMERVHRLLQRLGSEGLDRTADAAVHAHVDPSESAHRCVALRIVGHVPSARAGLRRQPGASKWPCHTVYRFAT